jgi:predicted kinase
MLIVFAGPPCAGKSTLAAEVARRRNLPLLAMDATRRRILPGAAHTRADRQVAYRAMHLAAELLLAAGASAILDAPYGHQEDRDELARISADADVRLIECRVSPETAIRRFLERGPDPVRLDLTEEAVGRMVREYTYAGDWAGRARPLRVDTEAESQRECLERIERYLRL